jgi:hypothetical protein
MNENALDDGSVPFELPARTTNTLTMPMNKSREKIVESLLQRLECLLPVISTETISTLRESMTCQPEGSVVVPGQLQWTVGEELSIALLRVSIHWSWQGATTTTTTCLLNVLSKRAQLMMVPSKVSHPGEDETKPHVPLARFENIQISLEQTITSKTTRTTTATTTTMSLLPTRLFCKLDTVKLLTLEFSSLTFSGILLEPPNIPISRLEQSQLEVVQVTSTLMSNNASSKPTSADHIFLASFLSILYTIRIPHASLLSINTTRLILMRNTTNSAFPAPSRMMAPFPSTATTTLGDVFRHFYNTAEDSADTMTKSMPTLNNAPVPTTTNMMSRSEDSNLTDSSHSNTNTNKNTSVSKWDKIRGSVSDSLAATAGCVVAGASFVTPIGAVASVAALGVKDAAHAAAQKGQQVRGATGKGYKFGDVARGIVASVTEKKQQQQQQQQHSRRAYPELDALHFEESGNADVHHPVTISRNRQSSSSEMNRPHLASCIMEQQQQQQQQHDMDYDSGTTTSSTTTSTQPLPQPRLSRYASVVGSSVGAGVGLVLLGGPIGFVAGSLVGSQATQSALSKNKRPKEETPPPPPPCTTSRTISGPVHADNSSLMHPNDQAVVTQLEHHHKDDDSSKRAFRLGDNLRGIVARGKESLDASDSSLMHPDDQEVANQQLQQEHHNDDSTKPAFRLGDNLRGIAAWAKESAHAEDSSLMHPGDQEVANQTDDSSKPAFQLGDNLRGIAAWGKESAYAEDSSLRHSDDQEGVNQTDDSSKPAFQLGDNLRGIAAWGKESLHADNSSLMHSDDQELANQTDDSSQPAFRLGDNLRGIAAWGKGTLHADNSSLMHSDEQESTNQQLEQDQYNDDSSIPAFRLGDNLRGIAARGQQATGRNESSSYQFGDFSRGLFSGKKR